MAASRIFLVSLILLAEPTAIFSEDDLKGPYNSTVILNSNYVLNYRLSYFTNASKHVSRWFQITNLGHATRENLVTPADARLDQPVMLQLYAFVSLTQLNLIMWQPVYFNICQYVFHCEGTALRPRGVISAVPEKLGLSCGLGYAYCDDGYCRIGPLGPGAYDQGHFLT